MRVIIWPPAAAERKRVLAAGVHSRAARTAENPSIQCRMFTVLMYTVPGKRLSQTVLDGGKTFTLSLYLSS